jgi:hypothetical protein
MVRPPRRRSGQPTRIIGSGLDEFEKLARDHGSILEKSDKTTDGQTRPGIEWTRLIIRLPDDGTGALPIIRHIILRDSKSSTYKLALLRVLARIAEGSLGLTRPVNDQVVGIPFGLVAIFWLRQFKLVLQEGLPQMPNNVGLEGLGFVKDAYRRINQISPLDFRVAARFAGQEALFVHQANPGRSGEHQANAGDLYIIPGWAPGVRNHSWSKPTGNSGAGPGCRLPSLLWRVVGS